MQQARATVKLINNENGQIIGEFASSAYSGWWIDVNNLADGIYNLTAIATDVAGDISNTSTPLQLIIDRTVPTVNLTAALDNTTLVNGTKLTGTVNGTGSAHASLTYRFDNGSEIPITINASGTFAQPLDLNNLRPGSYVLTLTASHLAGNTKTVTYNLTVNNDTITQSDRCPVQ